MPAVTGNNAQGTLALATLPVLAYHHGVSFLGGVRCALTTVALTAALLVSTSGLSHADEAVPAPAPEPQPARVLVFGDSISAAFRYNARGTHGRAKAWWAYVAEAAGINPHKVLLSAESGSGALARGTGGTGRHCAGTTFGDRLDAIAATNPDVILVEVGRNDVFDCAKKKRVTAKLPQARKAINAYFRNLAVAADAQGVPRSNVYVFNAWGSLKGTGWARITAWQEEAARANGLTWVMVSPLTAKLTIDGVHPSARGASVLAERVIRSSDVVSAIRSGGTSREAVATGARATCSDLKNCVQAKVKTWSYGKFAHRSYWGDAPATPRSYVGYRLTHQGRSTSPLFGTTSARQWLTASLATGQALGVTYPRSGDVAWWPTAPPGAGEATDSGHVAIVENVATNGSWVQVSEVTQAGAFRTVKYSGPDAPRAYLRFARTSGSPTGKVTSVRATPTAVTVNGFASDPDAYDTGVRIRITVKQGNKTVTTTTRGRTQYVLAHTFAKMTLKPGKAKITIEALNAPGSQGSTKRLATRTVTVRPVVPPAPVE